MFVVYNQLGAAMCMLPAFIASLVFVSLPPSPDAWTFIGPWGLIVFVWDTLYRSFNREEDEAWLDARRGGHLFFIPVCFLGVIALWWYVHHALAVGYWLPRTTPDSNLPFH